ncbi:hypothetical protein [Brevundimonas sp. AJA228-03]|uniref:hypothetical protein n=1 Tax=Brevundimonas sp. AJA228-03 TaxID=2752515 RepID=UPI001FD8671B|nr:hypothetical protein [Brevundimonas sp. AJA228-03]
MRDGRITHGFAHHVHRHRPPGGGTPRPRRRRRPRFPAIHHLPPRALHARLLENAAQRRLRGMERKRADRHEDADYWLHAAPVAVRKACALREACSFAPLP